MILIPIPDTQLKLRNLIEPQSDHSYQAFNWKHLEEVWEETVAMFSQFDNLKSLLEVCELVSWSITHNALLTWKTTPN